MSHTNNTAWSEDSKSPGFAGTDDPACRVSTAGVQDFRLSPVSFLCHAIWLEPLELV